MLKNVLFLAFLFMSLNVPIVLACESCSLSRIGKQGGVIRSETQDKKWYVEYLFEHQNWEEMDANFAHSLHHQGHHVHDKSSDEIHHYTVGFKPASQWTLSLEMPYVVRRSIEIDSHATLGKREISEGFGDVQFVGQYDFLKREDVSLGVFSGIKLPTGSTKELNSAGTQFEPELQPGSGSFDYLWGAAYHQQWGRFEGFANVSYMSKNQGAAEFTFGDVLSTSASIDYIIDRDNIRLKPGIHANYQYENKQRDHGSAVADSGGQTILLGPALDVGIGDFNVFGSCLYPVVQNLGGVHQELDYTYILGAMMRW
jgi:hypothetical protein